MADLKKSQVPRRDAIEDQVLVALRRIIRSIDIHSRTLVKHYGLTGPQLVVLQEISKHDEITPGCLAEAVSLSQATVTGILDRLEKRGLIARRRSETDRRRVLVSITVQADHMLDTGPPIMQLSFVDAFKGLQNWEQTMILSALQRLVALMDAEALVAAPIMTTETICSPEENLLSGPPTDITMEKEHGKDRH
jgi:DNA-binding MarR family transcriptional regulator